MLKKCSAGMWVSILVLIASASSAQARDRDASSDMECTANHGGWGKSANFAQSRQERLASEAINEINPGQNGSIRLHGWTESDVLVKACVQTSADSDAEARALATEVHITKGAGHIEASGPHNENHRNWSVSYEIWMPTASEAKLEASNGSISVEGVKGRLRLRTLNGSVKLTDVGGEVDGETTNGSVMVSVSDGYQMTGGLKLVTTNGSVRLELPESFSAQVQASTVNGSIRTDFPITVSGEIGKHLAFTLGSGGPEIEARTTNGSIHIMKRG